MKRLIAVLLLLGCEAQPCVRQSDCHSGLVCQAGACVPPPSDAMDEDAGALDAGADASTGDGGSTDAGRTDGGPRDAPTGG